MEKKKKFGCKQVKHTRGNPWRFSLGALAPIPLPSPGRRRTWLWAKLDLDNLPLLCSADFHFGVLMFGNHWKVHSFQICTEKQTSSGIHPNEPKPPRLPLCRWHLWPASVVKIKKNHDWNSWNPKSSNWRNKLSQLLGGSAFEQLERELNPSLQVSSLSAPTSACGWSIPFSSLAMPSRWHQFENDGSRWAEMVSANRKGFQTKSWSGVRMASKSERITLLKSIAGSVIELHSRKHPILSNNSWLAPCIAGMRRSHLSVQQSWSLPHHASQHQNPRPMAEVNPLDPPQPPPGAAIGKSLINQSSDFQWFSKDMFVIFGWMMLTPSWSSFIWNLLFWHKRGSGHDPKTREVGDKLGM